MYYTTVLLNKKYKITIFCKTNNKRKKKTVEAEFREFKFCRLMIVYINFLLLKLIN